MKRKDFIKTSATFVTGTALAPLVSCKHQNKEITEKAVLERKNWAGNLTFKAQNLYGPTTVEEAQQLVRKLELQKAMGFYHCFNNIADNKFNQISTKNLNGIIEIDPHGKFKNDYLNLNIFQA